MTWPCFSAFRARVGRRPSGDLSSTTCWSDWATTGVWWNSTTSRRSSASRTSAKALDFTNRVGDLAEEQGHHPDIYLAWGKGRLTVWTHKIDGLTESDFVFAAKSDRVL